MPIDQPATTAAPSRRRLLGAGSLPAVGAQAGGSADLDDEHLAAFATQLELAAGLAYQAALDTEVLDGAWSDQVRRFQRHHQDVVAAFSDLLPNDDEDLAELFEGGTPSPRPEIMTGAAATLGTATDLNAILATLSQLEDQLAASYLAALGSIADKTSARMVSQVLAVESQHAVVLGRGAGTDVAALTPPVAGTDGALQPATN